MKKIKIGVLGFSNIAKRSVIPAIIANPMFELSMIGTRSPKNTKYYINNPEIKVGTYQQLIESDVDAIYVSLPVGLHFEYAMKVLKSKKHLLLEKTFTSTIETATEIVMTAYKHELVVMEGLMYQYHPLYKTVESLVKVGDIGETLKIEANFGFPHLEKNDIRYNADLGGGAILDALIYPLSFCLFISEMKYEKYGNKVYFDTDIEVDSRGDICLDFGSYQANITYGFGFSYRNEYKVWGSNGILAANRAFSRPPDYKNGLTIQKDGLNREIEVPAEDHFYNMINEFANKIIGKNRSIDSKLLERMTLISEIYKGSLEGRGIRL